MGPPCDCSSKCSKKISFEARQENSDAFDQKKNHDDKIDMISKLMIVEDKKSSKEPGIKNARENTCKYHLYFKVNDKVEKVRVCREMFLNMLNISNGFTTHATKNIKLGPDSKKDQRGRHNNRGNKIKDSTIQSVLDHVDLFEKKPSHYVRKDSKRLFFCEEGLNRKKLHKLYMEWVIKERPTVKPANSRQYSDIFNNQCKVGFYIPKKDQCNLCTSYDINKGNIPEKLEQLMRDHNINRQECRNLKEADKKKASADTSFCVAAFNLQKTLSVPRAETNILYYKSKYSLNNCTVYNLGTRDGHCYVWGEDTGKKGSCEVGSYVYNFIKSMTQKGIKKFNFYSDNCGGQNKNRFVFLMLLYAAIKFDVEITHRFLECGHSYNEGDSMHSAIETAAKFRNIYTPKDWVRIMKNARPDKPYTVIEVNQDIIFDFKDFVKNLNTKVNTQGENIEWTKIREINVSGKKSNIMKYKTQFLEDYKEINLDSKKMGQFDFKNYNLKKLYRENLGVPAKKIKDLKSLCDPIRGVIPAVSHYFYDSLKLRQGTAENDEIEENRFISID